MAACIFGLILGAANELFNLGIWHNDYPGIFSQSEDKSGAIHSDPVSFGTWAWQAAAMLGIATVIGTILHTIIERHEMRQAIMEAALAEEFAAANEGRSGDTDEFEPVPEPQAPYMACPECGSVFTDLAAYSEHLRRHG